MMTIVTVILKDKLSKTVLEQQVCFRSEKQTILHCILKYTNLKRFGVAPAVVVVVAVEDDVVPVVAVPEAVVAAGVGEPQGLGNGEVFSAPRCGFSSTLLDP